MEAPKVFISYSHDSAEHGRRVLTLSDRLRQDGIDCHIDQYEVSPPEGWPRWMVNRIEWTDFVLVVCTEIYNLRFRGKGRSDQGLGVKWEGSILTQELYDVGVQNTRFIPVVFFSQDTAHIPIILKGQTYYDVNTETGYEALYRHLTNQPRISKPILGKLKPMKLLNPVQDKESIMSDSLPIKKLRLFLSSPGDVEPELAKVHTVVDQVNRILGDSLGIVLEVIDWKTHIVPDMGRPQEVINQQVGDYDIFIGILWKRFGTPTGKAESGTEEEFNIAYANWQKYGRPRILFYLSQASYTPKDASEAVQWGKVLTFKDELQQKGLVRDYQNPEEFADLLREHLVKVLQEWFKPKTGITPQQQIVDFTPYLKYLRQETMYIDVRGLVTGQPKSHQFLIDDLYIPLKTRSMMKEDDRKERFEERPDTEVLLQEALKESRLFIKGDPGAGKTTFLRLIAYTLCKRKLGEETKFIFSDSPRLPLFIRIGALSRYIRHCEDRKDFPCPYDPDSPDWLLHYLESESKTFKWKLSSEVFQKELEEGRCIILFDGLDEAPNREVREHLSTLASKVVRAYPKCQVVMTSRPQAVAGEIQPIDFYTVEIAPLDETAMGSFLTQWCGVLYKDAPDKSREYKKELKEALKSRPEIFRMARTPVMLTALAVVHWNENQIPEQRAELYESIITWLLKARQQRPGRLKVDRCRKLLQKLALAMFTHPEGRQRTIDVRWAAEILAPEFQTDTEGRAIDKAESFLRDEMVDSGIIVEREMRLEFWHLSFQEYLAAFEISGQLDDKLIDIVFHHERLYTSEWREVMFLFAGVLYKSGLARVNYLIDEIIKRGPEEKLDNNLPEFAKKVGLMGGMVRDLSPFDFQPSNSRYTEIVQSVMGILDKKTFRTIPVTIRIEAADTLGRVGDPRFNRKNELWIYIPTGSFWMGAQSKNPEERNYDKDARDNESPVHEVQLSEFWINKYPVTVEQYKRFIDDEGYKKEHFWKAGGFGEFTEPKNWEEQVGYPTRPVVYVSWYEAKAYAQWKGCCLPTEAEWERAARGAGEEYRKYPWGNKEAEKETMNFADDNWKPHIGNPTPVGIFPESCSPEGVIDMAGNVWEWCEDWLGDYSIEREVNPTGPERGSNRVVRGGSWFGIARSCRSAFRDRM